MLSAVIGSSCVVIVCNYKLQQTGVSLALRFIAYTGPSSEQLQHCGSHKAGCEHKPSGMWRHVFWKKFTDASEELTSCHFTAKPSMKPARPRHWRWSRYIPPTRCYNTEVRALNLLFSLLKLRYLSVPHSVTRKQNSASNRMRAKQIDMMRTTISWDATQCSLVNIYRRFRRTDCL
jgi:hypothetical protein